MARLSLGLLATLQVTLGLIPVTAFESDKERGSAAAPGISFPSPTAQLLRNGWCCAVSGIGA